MLRFTAPSLAVLLLIGLAPSASSAQACSTNWKCGVDYGGNTKMDLYVPANVKASPGIVVSLHYCGGNSSNARPWFQPLADKYGFTIITPGAGGNCFDAKPERSGERDAIVKMVKYVIAQNHADAGRVFAAGASSGACMTNALLAAYPDVFAGGSVLAGVPAGAWTGGNEYGWTTPAGNTAQAWGDIVRKADPGFTGARPHVQLWHGTADTTLNYNPNFAAEVSQWTNVLGVTDSNAQTSTFPGSQDSWARTSYKNAAGVVVLETNVANNAPHDLSGRGLWTDVVRFFGLDMDAATSSGGTGGVGGAASIGGTTASGGANQAGAANGGTGGSGGVMHQGGAVSSAGANLGGASVGGAMTVAGDGAIGGAMLGGGGVITSAGASNTAAGSATSEPTDSENGARGCACSLVGHGRARGSWGALCGSLCAGFTLLRRRRARR